MDYKKINDYEVLYMIKENDDYSEKLMYKKYLPIIKKIASKYNSFVSSRGADYEDLIQEGYVGLSNAINSYNDKLNTLFYTYASLCIERQINVFCRNMSSKKNEVLNTCNYEIDINKYSNRDINNPEHINIKHEDYEEFINTKNYFDLKYSSVFELRYNGFTYKEIAILLDLSISTIDGRLSKIRKTLHKLGKITI